jgi:hypothetical protein
VQQPFSVNRPLPIREVDTLRGISIPAQHTGSFSASATIPPAADKSRTTALVIAMLGATLSLSVAFVAFGNGSKGTQAAAAAAATTVTTPAQVSTAVAEQRGKNATVIAPPPKAIPVGIVEIDAPKGAHVFVDNVLFGTAPIHVSAPMGLHTVRVESRSQDIVFGEDAQTAHFDAEPITARRVTIIRTSAPRATTPVVRPTTPAAPPQEKTTKRPGKQSDLDQAKDLSAQATRDLGNTL